MLRAGLWHRGIQRLVSVEAPPAGQDWIIQVPTVPEGVWWRPKAIVFRLTTTAVVATRNVYVKYMARRSETPGWEDAYMFAVGNSNHTAGVTFSYSVNEAGGVAALGVVSDVAVLPFDVRVAPGHYIGTFTNLLDVGDQFNNIRLLVEEWIYEPPAEVVPNAGDGADRVDFVKLNDSLDRLAALLEALQSGTATP